MVLGIEAHPMLCTEGHICQLLLREVNFVKTQSLSPQGDLLPLTLLLFLCVFLYAIIFS